MFIFVTFNNQKEIKEIQHVANFLSLRELMIVVVTLDKGMSHLELLLSLLTAQAHCSLLE